VVIQSQVAAPTMNSAQRILSLVLRWQELRRQGKPLSVEQLCADCPELADDVAREVEALGAVLDMTNATITSVPPTIPPAVNEPAPALPLPDQVGRFRVLGEIAHGGMGAVLRAHDPAIGRDVAVKIILPQHRNDPASIRRFFDEVRLTGQLQHPGIPPVYDLGQLPDGRPFFAMKLIEGRTLFDLLREQRGEADLPRFLRYFEAVCQAVGCAHQRGVIHRDLKPSNVMVGEFGEVQVMDWGLAKQLQSTEQRVEAETALAPADPASPEPAPNHSTRIQSDTSSITQVGSAVGTAGYMAPEQARGEVDRLDARTDVFALGAILCEILTGGPPFRGTDVLDRLARTARGELAGAFTRLDGCGADPELVQMARTFLAAEQERRPGDANAVAASVAAYLSAVQERQRQAEVARARSEEERQRRRRQLAQGHSNRGDTLHRQGRFKEAEAAYREAVCFLPDNPTVHVNLGVTLGAQGRFEEAEAAYREALRLDTDNAVAHWNLGGALQEQGRFAEALEAFRRGHALGSKAPGLRTSSAEWLRQAERLVELDGLLPGIQAGAAPSSPSEGLELAALCQHPARRLHGAAVRLTAAAFAAEPTLADDLQAQPRYNAACSAVLTAGGQTADGARVSKEVAAELRALALAWLRADLDAYRAAGQGELVRQRLAHWQADADLASVRDRLNGLPDAERDAWRRLWEEVAALA
jgi:Flp pilus assembly protein TadD